MIFWTRCKPSQRVVDLLKLKVLNNVSLDEAAKSLANSGKLQYQLSAKTGLSKLDKYLDVKRKIESFTVKDAIEVFNKGLKNVNEAEGFQIRAALVNSIRFSVTGEVPKPLSKPPIEAAPGNTDGTDIGKLKFYEAPLDSQAFLIPLYNMYGRFGAIKAKIQMQLASTKPGNFGVIEAPVRSMNEKEAKAIVNATSKMLNKSTPPWLIKWNPAQSVFVVVRESDFLKLTKQEKGMK